MTRSPPLSVLDVMPVPEGATPSQAVHHAIDLARHAEALGMKRYWVAEHHNTAALASSSPEIMIGAIAAATRSIRVGSGGIMLPNHASLRVAESFRVLSALHPGRIDLGLGRAPGTDKKTALALRRSRELLGAEGFPAQLDELLGYLGSDPDPALAFAPTKAAPTGVPAPPIFILGSSVSSAAFAAERGLAFAYAHHFDPKDAEPALERYRADFRPSRTWASPYAIVAVAALCAETDAAAERLATSGERQWLRFGRGLRDLPLPTVESALAEPLEPEDEQLRAASRGRQLVGSAQTVITKLNALVDTCDADEVLVTTVVHDQEARRRSYALLVDRFARR